MTILDIGAGTGQQSYRLSAALKGTGRVYASEISPRLVAYIAAQAKKRGLANLESMLVSPDGVDQAYFARTYDLILMYNVHTYLKDHVAYYSRLRSLLKPNGRIALIENEPVPNRSFYREDVKDWSGLIDRIQREPLDAPFGKAVLKPLRPLLQAGASSGARELERAVLLHLNRTLDYKFYLLFTQGLSFNPDVDFTQQERSYAEWGLHRLALDEVAGTEPIRMERHMFGLMQNLNKLLVVQRYRHYLAFGDAHPYWSRALEARWYLEHDWLVQELMNAGYSLERRIPLPPFQALWIFRPEADPPSGRASDP